MRLPRTAGGAGPRRMARRGRAGITLLELVITVAVIGILAAIAYPSYLQVIRKGARADAKAILMENAQFMERHFTTNNTYAGAAVISTVAPKNASSTSKKYDISWSVTPTATAYTAQAVPANTQVGDSCGTLTISHTGPPTPTTGGCW